jgi:hypothetical protein
LSGACDHWEKVVDYVYVIILDCCSGSVMVEVSAIKLLKKVSTPYILGELVEAVNGSLGSFKSITVNLR